MVGISVQSVGMQYVGMRMETYSSEVKFFPSCIFLYCARKCCTHCPSLVFSGKWHGTSQWPYCIL